MTTTKILVVEDEGIVALDIQRQLQELGYGVAAITASGEEAVRLARTLRPALILMDIHLQGSMDGIQAAETINRSQHLPVIYVTAYADTRTLERAKRTRPYGYINKPFELRDLKTTIEIALYRAQAETTEREYTRRLEQEIAERKKVEQALTRERELLQVIMDNMPDWIFFKDTQSRIMRSNRSHAQLFGVDDPQELMGKTDFDLFPFEDAQRFYDEEQQLIQTKQAVVGRVGQTPNQEGDMIWVSETKVPIINEVGDVTGLVGISRNISDQKRAEESLQTRETWFRTLVERFPLALQVFEANGVLVQVNQAWEILWGTNGADVVGVFNPLEDEQVKASGLARLLERVFAGNKVHIPDTEFDPAISGLPGKKRWIRTHASHIKGDNGQVQYVVVLNEDITERKQTETALRYQSTLLQNISDAVISTDTAFIIRSWNNAAEAMYGWQAGEVIGKPMNDIVPTAYPDRDYETVLSEFLANGQWQGEVTQTCKDGEAIHVLASVSLILDGDGQPTGAVAVNRDITALKNAQDALQESEQRFRQLAGAAFEGLCIHDNGVIVDANHVLASMFGHEPADVIDMNIMTMVAPESYEIVLSNLRSGSEAPFEAEALRKDGTTFLAEVFAKTMPYHGRDVRVAAVRDITARKQAEEALRESEEKHRTLFETMSQGVVYQAADGAVTSTNPAAERILWLTLDQMQGRMSVDSRWKAIHENGSVFPGEAHPAMVALETGKEVHDVVMGVFNPQYDEYRWIIIDAVPLFKPGEDAPYQVYTTFDDVTARRQAEQQRIELAMERERVKMLASFIQDMSHEFRTPLSVINTKVYLLEQVASLGENAAHIQIIKSQADYITDLVEAMLTTLRLDTRADHEFVTLQVNDLLQDIATRVQHQLDEKQLAFVVNLDDALPTIQGDRTKLYRAFLNLATNAVQNTFEGTITLRTYPQNHQVVIEIQDTGSGIAAENLPHIFDHFYRVDNARTTRGAGLGLYIARKVIAAHQGHIEVQSTLNMGSTFRVLLPVHTPPH